MSILFNKSSTLSQGSFEENKFSQQVISLKYVFCGWAAKSNVNSAYNWFPIRLWGNSKQLQNYLPEHLKHSMWKDSCTEVAHISSGIQLLWTYVKMSINKPSFSKKETKIHVLKLLLSFVTGIKHLILACSEWKCTNGCFFFSFFTDSAVELY